MAVTYEATIISLGLPVGVINFINADIGPSTQATWIATAWTLSGAVTQTITGRCSDIFGRRYMILSGNILSLVGSYLDFQI
jgi:MFS family permease